MNPKIQRAIRVAARELLDIETAAIALGKQAGAARVNLASILPDPERDKPDPPRPVDPPKPVEPPTRPPAGGEVLIMINGTAVRLYPQDGAPDQAEFGDLAIVAAKHGDDDEVVIANSFAGSGDLEVKSLQIKWPGGRLANTPDPLVLHPGHALFAFREKSKPAKSDLPAVNAWRSELEAGGGGMERAGGIDVYGNGDANEGGGQLIYPWIEHWADSQAGTACAQIVMMGYATRMPIFRWDRAAFEQGRIEPHKWGDDFQGIDRTATYAPEGFALHELHNTPVGRSLLPKVGGTHDALDHQHLGRIGHVTAWCAQQGSPMARVILNALAEDVRLSWAGGFGFGKAQVENPSNPNFVYWDCFDVRDELLSHEGCPFMGREFAHAMMVTANAVLYADNREIHRSTLLLMLSAMAYVYDRRNKTVLKLTKLAPVFGYPSGGYAHKRGVGQPPEVPHNIPDGKNPPVVKQFETGLLVCALDLTMKALGQLSPTEFGVYTGLVDSLKRFDQELRAIGHPAWGSDKGVLWSPLVLGERASRFGEPDLDLRQIAATTKPNDGSNPCAAFSGNWEDLA